MSTKLEKMAAELNEKYRDEFKAAFLAKFGVEVNFEFSIFTFQITSRRVDGVDFTVEQYAFAQGYSDGFGRAIQLVSQREQEDWIARDAKQAERATQSGKADTAGGGGA